MPDGVQGPWDWESVARTAGVTADGVFNCASLDFSRATLLWVREDFTTQRLTGAEFTSEILHLAAALAGLGVERGDRVAITLSRRPEAYTLPLAIWSIGAICVPLFSGFGPDSLAVRLIDSEPKAMFVDGSTRSAVDRLEIPSMPLVIDLDDSKQGEVDFRHLRRRADSIAGPVPTSKDDPATIMYTSGTTGRPKGCIISHQGILSLWPYIEHFADLQRTRPLFATADPGWSFGLYTTGLAPMSLGYQRLLYEGAFSPERWWEIVRRFGADQVACAPTAYRQLMVDGPISGETPPIRSAFSAGEPLDSPTTEWFKEHLGITIRDSYGLTELGMVTGNMASGGEAAPIGSMGAPLPGFDVKVVDEAGNDLEPGAVGLLAVKDNGHFLGSGYWNRDSEWQQRLDAEGWWVTEDRVRREDDGSFMYIGRADDVIVTSGYNVGPSEVERAVLSHPNVAEAACVGAPDALKGQVVVLFVVGRNGFRNEGLGEELRRLVGTRVGWHSAPRRVEIVEALPRTESGKIRRGLLRSWAMESE